MLGSYCMQFQPCLERLVFSVAEVVRCKSFLEAQQGIALKKNNLSVVTFYLQTGIWGLRGSCSHVSCSQLPRARIVSMWKEEERTQ